MRRVRIFMGFIFAPLLPPLLVDAYSLLSNFGPRPPLVSMLPTLLSGGEIRVAYTIAFFAGIPLFLWMRAKGWNQWWHYCLGGAALGSLPAAWALGYDVYSGDSLWVEAFLAVGSIYGAISAFLFWVIAIAGGPTKLGDDTETAALRR
ncbi:MAG: hypothetical protein ACYDGU_03090 [Acidiferrobacterales bacterium]